MVRYCDRILQIEKLFDENLDEENPIVYFENNLKLDKSERAIEYFEKCQKAEALKNLSNNDQRVLLGNPITIINGVVDDSKAIFPVCLTTESEVIKSLENGTYCLPNGYFYKTSKFTKSKGLEILQRVMECELDEDFLTIRFTEAGKDLLDIIYSQCFVNALQMSATIVITEQFMNKTGKIVHQCNITAKEVESFVDYQLLASKNPKLKNYTSHIIINCYLETKVLS